MWHSIRTMCDSHANLGIRARCSLHALSLYVDYAVQCWS
jgi:hypothetical protein